MKLIQEEEVESDDMQRRINQLIEVQHVRDRVQIKSQDHQARMKEIFDKRTKERNFMVGDTVLKWDVEKGSKGETWKI
jgi:hypothetical protein